MNAWLTCRFALLVVALLFVTAKAAAPPGLDVARLIEQLGSDVFAEREAATARLKEIGEPALDALHRAQTSPDLEVRRRAARIATAVEIRLFGPELVLAGHTGQVWSVCVSADGKRVLTGSHDRTLRLWDADTGKPVWVLAGHTQRIGGAALSPDGKRALSGGTDRSVRLWDVDSGKELRRYEAHAAGVTAVAFFPDGKRIASASLDGTARIWRAPR